MDKKQTGIFTAVILLLVVGIIGMYAYNVGVFESENPEENPEKLDYDHSITSHSSEFEESRFEEAPSYTDAVTAHSEELGSTSYKFEYDRSYADSSTSEHISVNYAEKLVSYETRITSNGNTIAYDGYYTNGVQYTRSRQDLGNSDSWTYSNMDSDFTQISRTGLNKINSAGVQGVAFEYETQITRNGTTYYVYKPEVIDQEQFESNRFFPEDDASMDVSINGEVLVSEYGIVVSSVTEFSIGDTTVKSTYTVTDIGDIDINEPIWLSEAEQNTS